MSDIIDAIDALVDEQLEQERSGYDHNINQAQCPHCGREWHGLPITRDIERMRATGRYDENYEAAQDNSSVLCHGSEFIGPITLDGIYCPCPFCYIELLGVPRQVILDILENAAQNGETSGTAAIRIEGPVVQVATLRGPGHELEESAWRTVGTLTDGTETVDPENAYTPADFGEQPCI